jgi:hypothetical protein
VGVARCSRIRAPGRPATHRGEGMREGDAGDGLAEADAALDVDE